MITGVKYEVYYTDSSKTVHEGDEIKICPEGLWRQAGHPVINGIKISVLEPWAKVAQVIKLEQTR